MDAGDRIPLKAWWSPERRAVTFTTETREQFDALPGDLVTHVPSKGGPKFTAFYVKHLPDGTCVVAP